MTSREVILHRVTIVIVILAAIGMMFFPPSVTTRSLSDIARVEDDGYITIDGYSDVKAEGARVFTTRTGFAIAPVTKETTVIATKSGRFRIEVACGVIGPGQVAPGPSNDDFVEGLVSSVRSSFSQEYYKYFPMLAKVYRDSYAKNFATWEELRQSIVSGSREVLGFDEPEKDSVMEAQFQTFFGPDGTLAKYVYEKYPEITNWGTLIPQIASAFERI